MGRDKAFVKFKGEPLIEILVKKLRKIFSEIIIVTNQPAKYRYLNLPLTQDLIKNKGSLGGIYSGLLVSENFYNFVTACDMPFVNLELIRYMIKKKDSYDVVIPKIGSKYEPLFCIYSKKCLRPIREQFDKGDLTIRHFFEQIKSREIKGSEIKEFGKPEELFFNLNCPEDLGKLR